MKHCTICLVLKPLEEFHRDAKQKDGRYYHCKPCRKIESKKRTAVLRERREKHKAELEEEYKKWAEDNQEQVRIAKDQKVCSSCFVPKPLDEFHKNRTTRDGYVECCKTCRKTGSAEYYARNRDRILDETRTWAEDNKERRKKIEAAYRQRNRARIREFNKAYRARTPEKQYLKGKKHREENPELYRSYIARRNARKRGTLTEYDISKSSAYRKAIANDPCFYCGTIEADVYHDDHYFPLAKGGDDRWYNLVRACESCNLSKNAKCGTVFILMKGSVSNDR